MTAHPLGRQTSVDFVTVDRACELASSQVPLSSKRSRQASVNAIRVDWPKATLVSAGDAVGRPGPTSSAVSHQVRQLDPVNVTNAFALLWLIPRLPDFQKRHPHIVIEMATVRRPVVLDDSVEMAIAYSRHAPPVAGGGRSPEGSRDSDGGSEPVS